MVQKELRRTLLKYKRRTDQELFDKAYGYIRQYYQAKAPSDGRQHFAEGWIMKKQQGNE